MAKERDADREQFWRRALKRRDAAFQTERLAEAPGLVPLEVVEDHYCTAPVEIVVNQNLVIRVSEQATTDHLRRVLQAVSELG